MISGCGSPVFDGLCRTLSSTAPSVSARVNTSKGAAVPHGAAVVPWCASGFYLDSRPGFTFDPAMHQGLYYVQDASSMAVSCAVRTAVRLSGEQGRPLRYMDACAAPGGKTLGALEVLPSSALVVANEYSRQRAAALAENLAKWGAGHAVVTCCDASAIRGMDGFFDIIGADVPCSGEGMMRKEPEAAAQWSAALVAECAALQRRIVESLWQALRPGGFMIYSTCTFNTSENEDNVRYMVDVLGAEAVAVDGLDCPGIAAGIGVSEPCYRFIPGLIRGEGQFVALLRKPDCSGGGCLPRPRSRSASFRSDGGVPPQCAEWLDGDWQLWVEGGVVRALPRATAADTAVVAANMRVLSCGLEMAAVKGRDVIPTQQMALSTALRAGVFERVEVTPAQALAYLERNAVTLPDGTPRGYVLLTCCGAPLGFVKNIGNRCNNLYPAGWRVLSCGREPVRVLD